MRATRISQDVRAPRAAVYRALLDASAVVTGEMTMTIEPTGWRLSLRQLAALVEAGA